MTGLPLLRIERTESPSPLMAKAVVAGRIVTTCFTPADPVPDFAEQARQVFARIDHYLELGGASRATLLTAQVWLRDVANYEAFVDLWNGWVDPGNPPVLSIIGSHLAREAVWLEIKVIAVATS